MRVSSGGSLKQSDLFQQEDGGSSPTSPLQLRLREISAFSASEFNKRWHSRLPVIRNYFCCCLCFGAFFGDECFATAMWGRPVARAFNGKPVLELRRMAIKDKAPKNTASRMIGIMISMIRKKYPHINQLISYQDCDVHTGTIYKASGWIAGRRTKASEVRWGVLNKDGTGRKRSKIVAGGDKVRWEKLL
jgi:hypothetical protein